ncbi:MAG: response regulator transcription factor [Tannerellaceae bacterium]|nr:response regulator transcription factor [Tannerellaceae bacterium]
MCTDTDLTRILIADASHIVRTGLETVLRGLAATGLHLAAVSERTTLMAELKRERQELLIVSPALLGRESVGELREAAGCPAMKCVAVICQLYEPYLLRGYDGLLSIYDSPEEIRNKLALFCNGIAREAATEEEYPQTLSKREEEIVACVARGMTTRDIAQALFLSEHTVVTHRRNIARKLQIHSASALTTYAIMNGLVELSDVKA